MCRLPLRTLMNGALVAQPSLSNGRSPKDVLCEDAVVGEFGVLDREAAPLDHRLEKPGVSRVLVTNMFLELTSAPALSGGRLAGGAPGFDAVPRLRWVEAVHDVPQTEHTAWSKDLMDPRQGDGLPEVWEMMERVAGVNEVRGASSMLVGQEASLDNLDVVYPRSF